MIRLDQIRTDGGTQSRAAINDETVAEYAEAMADPVTVFPPATVYYDGRDYWLADGFHRVAAWARIGREEVPCEVRQGDRRAAVLHSCGANASHGLRRTNADKRRAVMTMLEDAEWAGWADRAIARQCGVSPSFVGSLRSLSVNDGQIDGMRTVERNGTTYTQDTSRIGGSDGSEPVVNQPEAAPVHKPSDTSGADKAGTSVANDAADGPAPTPDPHAKLRAEYRKLTDEAREQDWIDLRIQCLEDRKRIERQRSEIADLKRAVKEFSEGSDLGAKVSNLMTQLGAAKYARDEAMRATKRMEYLLKKARKDAEIVL